MEVHSVENQFLVKIVVKKRPLFALVVKRRNFKTELFRNVKSNLESGIIRVNLE